MDEYRNQQRVKCSGEQVTNTSRMRSTPKIPTNQTMSRAFCFWGDHCMDSRKQGRIVAARSRCYLIARRARSGCKLELQSKPFFILRKSRKTSEE
jgi:hypothetical protein